MKQKSNREYISALWDFKVYGEALEQFRKDPKICNIRMRMSDESVLIIPITEEIRIIIVDYLAQQRYKCNQIIQAFELDPKNEE